MRFNIKGNLPLLLFLIFFSFLQGQNSVVENMPQEYLGAAFDLRRIDLLDLTKPTLLKEKGSQIIIPQQRLKKPLNNSTTSEILYVSNPYDFEQKILKSDTIANLYLSENSQLFNKNLLNNVSQPVLVYKTTRMETRKESFALRGWVLDSLFIEAVDRLFEDLTVPGFVHRFGTHYASEVIFGGSFMTRVNINKKEFIYSPYDEVLFKKKTREYIDSFQENNPLTDPFLNVQNSVNIVLGGDESSNKLSVWKNTITNNEKPVDVSLVRISRLLTNENFPEDTEIERKRVALDLYINFIESNLKQKIKKPQEGDYFTKYAIPFKQRLISIVKKSSGREKDNTSPYTGDLFFGGFTSKESLIFKAPVIERGGLSLQTLITDEVIEVNKVIEYIVPHIDFDKGFANVWDDSKKLIKGVGRTTYEVTGEEDTRIYFKEALRENVYKTINLKTIDSDLYEVVFSLEHVNVSNELKQLQSRQNYVMDSELIAAASNGNLKKLENYHTDGVNLQVKGLVRAAIISLQPPIFFNNLFDLGVKPSQEDLDLLFDTDYYNREVALIFLERGAKPKNNMLFKAVAYRSPNVVKALIREGAEPANNDLDYAIQLKDLELVSALTGKEVVGISGNQISYRENDQIIKPQTTIEEYVVRKGDYLGKIATMYNVSVKDLRVWNELKSNTIFVNQKIKVYLNKTVATNQVIAKSSKDANNVPNGSETIYSVKEGDFLGKIADDHKVTVSSLKKWNNLTSDLLKEGQKLTIFTLNPDIQTRGDYSVSQFTASVKTPESNATKIDTSAKTEDSITEQSEAVSLDNFIIGKEHSIEDIYTAVYQENEALAIKLIEQLKTNDEKLMQSAIRKEQPQVVEALLKNGTDPNQGIDLAIYYRQLPTLKILLDNNKVKITQNEINLVIKTEFPEAFKLFIDKGFDPTLLYKGESAIHQIVLSYSPSRKEMLSYVLEKGYSINIKNSNGETPLHKAVKVGKENIPIINLLLENNGDIDAVDNQGNSVYSLAQDRAVRILISKTR